MWPFLIGAVVVIALVVIANVVMLSGPAIPRGHGDMLRPITVQLPTR